MNSIKTLPGKPYNDGVRVFSDGVNFSVFSRNATAVFLEIFKNEKDSKPLYTIEFDSTVNRTGDIWHVFVVGLKPGDLYLYRVDGPSNFSQGHRFNKENYLFDPKAKAFTNGSVFKNMIPGASCPLEKMPKCVVVDDSYEWEGDKPLSIPLNKTIIYEMHVKGFTADKSSLVKNSGTYKGLIEKIPYLKELGITAVELLPIQEFDEYENTNVNPRTGDRMKNYWGYSTIGFFAPKVGYSSNKEPGFVVKEFKDMVKAFHSAGIEVILDVVFNHTAEGNEHGISLNFRGFDNSIYYHLVSEHLEYYVNFSGCGNTVNCNHPIVQDFIIDCLRYWVLEMHIDGFRFDLASVLCRDEKGFLLNEPSLTRRISEDPILKNTKIIAEPWDCGGGYQTGHFPGGRWCEWNDKFRDGIRKFIRGDEYISTEAATRIAGSSDLYLSSKRSPFNSINYVVSHDGFTLKDLVTYNYKHNEQNGEDNRDGTDNNLSYNYGFEGFSQNPKIERIRNQQIKNFFTVMMISQGVPMFVAGDEVMRSQGGNNNPYCQDNEISWFNWHNTEQNKNLYEFVKKLIRLRKEHYVFTRTDFFGGTKTAKDSYLADITWFNYDGSIPDWSKMNRFLAFRLGGVFVKEENIRDNDFYIAINTDIHDKTITLPLPSAEKKWYRTIDTSMEENEILIGNEEELKSQEKYVLLANSIIVLISK